MFDQTLWHLLMHVLSSSQAHRTARKQASMGCLLSIPNTGSAEIAALDNALKQLMVGHSMQHAMQRMEDLGDRRSSWHGPGFTHIAFTSKNAIYAVMQRLGELTGRECLIWLVCLHL